VAEGTGVEINDRGFVVADDNSAPPILTSTPLVTWSPTRPTRARWFRRGDRGDQEHPRRAERAGRLRPSAVAIYSNPEVAFCGLTEASAKEKGYDVVVKKDPFGGNSRAQIIGDTRASSRSSPRSGPTERLARSWRAHGRTVGDRTTRRRVFRRQLEATAEEAAALIQPHPSLSETFGETLIALAGRDSTLADVTLPSLGESVTEGIITQWFKKVGDTVARDEPLFEVSTDKVDSEMPSPAAGVLTQILAEEGDTVETGSRVASSKSQARRHERVR